MTNIFGYGSFGGRSAFMGEERGDLEETSRRLDSLKASIERERDQDAATFQALVAAGQRRLDLVFELKKAEEKLAAESKQWETGHSNAGALEAAQQAYDAVQSQYEQIKAQIQTYRDAVNSHAAAIESYWSRVEDLISSLPEDQQTAARTAIETCRPSSMKGSGICAHGENELGCKKCQRGRKRKQYQRPPGLFQQMNGGFLGKVPLAGLGQTTTMSPTSTPPPAPAPAAVNSASASNCLTSTQIGVGVGILALALGIVVFSRG